MVASTDNGLRAGLISTISKYSPNMPGPARLQMIRQLNQLVRELAEPVDVMSLHREQMLELVAIRSLLSMKVFQHIPEEGSISAKDLGVKVDAEEALLLRLMKMAVSSQILIQHKDETFSHTKYSRSFAAPLGTWLDFQVVYDECFMPLSQLHLWMKEKGRVEPDRQETSPALWIHGNEGKSFWEILKADKERQDVFDLCMKVKGENSPKGAYYDYNTLVDPQDATRTVLVDVGGGLGQTLLEVLKQCPDIKPSQLVLQDQAQVVASAEKSGTLPAEMNVMAYDYNDPQPVHGARGYMMRRVLHSYSDNKCIEVLKELKKAMAPDSKLLISDFIVPEVASPADIGSVSAALAMMGQGGKERTITEFKRVFAGAGFELTGVFRPEKGPFGMLEAKLLPVDPNAEVAEVAVAAPVTKPVEKPVQKAVEQPIVQSLDQTVAIQQSIDASLKQLIAIAQSIDSSLKQPVMQPLVQSVEQSIKKPNVQVAEVTTNTA